MIVTLMPLAAGNAVRLYLTPPAGALSWRILRKSGAAADIPSHDTPGVAVVVDRCDEEVVLDYLGLLNGTAYTWRAFYLMRDGSWRATAAASTTPEASYREGGSDVQAMLRERIAAGIKVEIARGALKPASGKIPVITAPHASSEQVTLPVISVHFDNGAPSERALSDELATIGGGDDEDGWTTGEGWLANHTLGISTISLNSDERAALRQAILRVLVANADVFAAAGLITPSWSWRDNERTPDREASTVHFTTDFTFTCIAPVLVTHELATVRDVLTNPIPYNMEPTYGR